MLLVGALLFLTACDDDGGTTDPPAEGPTPIHDLVVAESRGTSLLLEWTSPGQSVPTDRADSLDLRFAVGTTEDWERMTIVSPSPVPSEPGVRQRHWIHGLNANSQYKARLRFRNTEGAWSDPSRAATGQTTELGSLVFANSELATPERDETVVLVISRVGSLLDSAAVTVESVPGSAAPGRDFRGLLQVLSFPPGAVSDTVRLTIVDNDEARGTRDFTIRMVRPFGVRVGTPGSVKVWIDEDDTGFRFGPGDHRSSEPSGTLTIPVERVGNPNTVLTVEYASLDGTATGGLDFDPRPGILSFAAGETEQSIAIALLDDRYLEGEETFLVRLHSPSFPAQLPESPTEAHLDDDDAVVIDFVANSPLGVGEEAGWAEVGVGRFEDGLSYEPIEVRYRTVFGTGSASADESDVIVAEGTVEFAEPGARVQIPVALVDDLMVEGEEALWIEIYDATGGATIGSRPRAEIRIRDDDPARVDFLPQPDSFLESNGDLRVGLVRAGSGLGPIEVTVAPRDGTAREGSDFLRVSQRVSFHAPGDTAMVSIPLVDDTDLEGREDLVAQILATSPGVLGGRDLRMWIDDDDSRLAVSNLDVSESDGFVALVVRRSGFLNSTATVDYRRSGGTAIAGFDFVLDPGTLAFAPGVDSVAIPIEILQDEWIEGYGESIEVEILNPTGATIFEDRSIGTVRILDDDHIRLAFDPPDFTVSEGEESPLVHVRRLGSTLFRVAARPTATSGRAIRGSDFEVLGDSVVFEAGEQLKTFPLRILDDDEVEVREDFVLELEGEYRATGAVELIDDDGFGVRFQATELVIGERDSFTYARVELWGDGPAEEVLITYRTIDGTAVAGEDYFEAEGTMTLTPANSLQDIRIRVRDDDLEEAVESFQLELTEAIGGVLTEPRVITVIIEDE